MLDLGVCLRWYKQREVQEAILETAFKREVAVRYGDKGFGKRPDMHSFPKDVIEFAKKGATSFHVSEEHWENTSVLAPGLTQRELDAQRIGWDLVIDIDCPLWRYSKLITDEVVKLFHRFGIGCATVKFSGNKGFHIGVPLKAFPAIFQGFPIQQLFPEAPRNIALYVASKVEASIAKMLTDKDKVEIAAFLGKTTSEVFMPHCSSCGKLLPPPKRPQFICPKCGRVETPEKDVAYLICKKCNKIMDKRAVESRCPNCGSTEPPDIRFDLSKILQIDTMLISPRHLYRMVYSLHEKSGLASIPVAPGRVLEFNKQEADPAKAKVIPELPFLDSTKAVPGEAGPLLIESYDFASRNAEHEKPVLPQQRSYELPSTPVNTRLFPPCINNILKGLSEGRKRSLFILLNFLGNMGWDYALVEKYIIEWNKRNREPLKEGLIRSHLHNYKQKREIRLPPNCDRDGYYKDIQVCQPDEICQRIRNPVNYYKFKRRRKK